MKLSLKSRIIWNSNVIYKINFNVYRTKLILILSLLTWILVSKQSMFIKPIFIIKNDIADSFLFIFLCIQVTFLHVIIQYQCDYLLVFVIFFFLFLSSFLITERIRFVALWNTISSDNNWYSKSIFLTMNDSLLLHSIADPMLCKDCKCHCKYLNGGGRDTGQ